MKKRLKDFGMNQDMKTTGNIEKGFGVVIPLEELIAQQIENEVYDNYVMIRFANWKLTPEEWRKDGISRYIVGVVWRSTFVVFDSAKLITELFEYWPYLERGNYVERF